MDKTKELLQFKYVNHGNYHNNDEYGIVELDEKIKLLLHH